MSSNANKPLWQQRPEGGQRWIMSLYLWFALHAGRSVARVFLYPVAGWFFLLRGPERRASREFLRKATGSASYRQVFQHFLRFSQVVLDRVYLMATQAPPVKLHCEGLEALDSALAKGHGCLLMGSHLGSFEACRLVKEQRPEVPLRILMDRQLNANATEFLEMLNPELASQVIALGDQPAQNILQIREALDAGGLVALLADRAVGNEETTLVDVLGSPARLPVAPYLLASLTRAPVVLFFGLYQGGDSYRVVFETFSQEPLSLPRRSRRRRQLKPDQVDTQNQAQAQAQNQEQAATTSSANSWAQKFAHRLSLHARQNPYNWFNFYPFWDEMP